VNREKREKREDSERKESERRANRGRGSKAEGGDAPRCSRGRALKRLHGPCSQLVAGEGRGWYQQWGVVALLDAPEKTANGERKESEQRANGERTEDVVPKRRVVALLAAPGAGR
jgi:hypothetical protein